MTIRAALAAIGTLACVFSAQAQVYDVSAAWFKPQLSANREPELCRTVFSAYADFFASARASNPLTPISTRGDSVDASASLGEGAKPVEWLPVGEHQRLTQWRQSGKYLGIVERGESVGWRGPFYSYYLIDAQLSKKERTEGVADAHRYGALAMVRPAADPLTLDVVYPSDSRFREFNSNRSVTVVNVYAYRNRTYLVLATGGTEREPETHFVVTVDSPHHLKVVCKFTSYPHAGALAAQMASVHGFRDFQRVVGEMMGGSGSCGTMNSHAGAVNQMNQAFRVLLTRPWALIGQGAEYDFATWGHSGAWNHRKYVEFNALLPLIQGSLATHYARQYRLNDAAARELAVAATNTMLAESFGHGQTHDENAQLHQALLEGAPPERLTFLLDVFQEKDDQSDSLLTFAIGHPHLVEELLKRGFNPDKANAFGKTPLMYAAQFNDLASARILVRHGANTNLATTRPMDSCNYTIHSNGVTALHYAVRYSSSEFVRWLVDAGAAVTARDAAGHTPHDYLMRHGGPAGYNQPAPASYGKQNRLLDTQALESLAQVLVPPSADVSRSASDQENRKAESLYRSGDLQGAYRALKRALALDAVNERALSNLSLLALRLGHEGESAQAATAIIKTAKSPSEVAAAYFNLALACEAEGRKKYHYASIYYDGRSYCAERWDRYEGPLFYFLKAYSASPTAARSRAIAAFFQQADNARGKWLCRDTNPSSALKAVYVGRGYVYFLAAQGTEVTFSPFSLRDRAEKPLEVQAKEVVPIGDGLAVTRWQVSVHHQGTLVLGKYLCNRSLPVLLEDGLRLVEVHTVDRQVEVHSLTSAPVVLVLYGNDAAWKLSEASRNVQAIYVHGKGASVFRTGGLDITSHADDRQAYSEPSGSSFNPNTRSALGLPIHAIIDATARSEVTIDEALLSSLPACTVGRGALRSNCRPP